MEVAANQSQAIMGLYREFLRALVATGENDNLIHEVRRRYVMLMDAAISKAINAISDHAIFQIGDIAPIDLELTSRYGQEIEDEFRENMYHRLSADARTLLRIKAQNKAFRQIAGFQYDFKAVDRIGRKIDSGRFVSLSTNRFIGDVHNTLMIVAAIAKGHTELLLESTGSTWDGKVISVDEAISTDAWRHPGAITLSYLTKR